jgi:predicted outer membrane lipoprotein
VPASLTAPPTLDYCPPSEPAVGDSVFRWAVACAVLPLIGTTTSASLHLTTGSDAFLFAGLLSGAIGMLLAAAGTVLLAAWYEPDDGLTRAGAPRATRRAAACLALLLANGPALVGVCLLIPM